MSEQSAFNPQLMQSASKMFDLAREGATAELAAYVDAGVPANLTNEHGDTLLMLAAYHGQTESVQGLLARGADPNRANDRGQSPLAGAVFKGDVDIINLLLRHGADPDGGSPSAVATAAMFGREDLLNLLTGGTSVAQGAAVMLPAGTLTGIAGSAEAEPVPVDGPAMAA